MVEVLPRKGMIVKPVSLHDVLEIIEVRLVNESYCVRLAALQKRSPEEAEAAMRAHIESFRRNVSRHL